MNTPRQDSVVSKHVDPFRWVFPPVDVSGPVERWLAALVRTVGVHGFGVADCHKALGAGGLRPVGGRR